MTKDPVDRAIAEHRKAFAKARPLRVLLWKDGPRSTMPVSSCSRPCQIRPRAASGWRSMSTSSPPNTASTSSSLVLRARTFAAALSFGCGPEDGVGRHDPTIARSTVRAKCGGEVFPARAMSRAITRPAARMVCLRSLMLASVASASRSPPIKRPQNPTACSSQPDQNHPRA